jgi:hypothetical protein
MRIFVSTETGRIQYLNDGTVYPFTLKADHPIQCEDSIGMFFGFPEHWGLAEDAIEVTVEELRQLMEECTS